VTVPEMLPPVAASRSVETDKRKPSVRVDTSFLTTEELDFDKCTFASKGVAKQA
jgi:hypothetical protein